jgi:GAF domain-containing protein
VRMTTDEVQAIWPRLGQIAAGVGVRSFLAVPLHADGQAVGALNLYSADAEPPDPDPDLLTVLTEYADRGLTDYQNSQPYPTVEEAIRRGLVQWINGFTLNYARDVLRDQAEDWGRTLSEQAAHNNALG